MQVLFNSMPKRNFYVWIFSVNKNEFLYDKEYIFYENYLGIVISLPNLGAYIRAFDSCN